MSLELPAATNNNRLFDCIEQDLVITYSLRLVHHQRLGSASSTSRGGSSLGVGLTLFGLGTLLHHDGEGDVSTLGIFVSGLTRVDA